MATRVGSRRLWATRIFGSKGLIMGFPDMKILGSLRPYLTFKTTTKPDKELGMCQKLKISGWGVSSNSLFKCLFIYFESERERERERAGEGQRERRENPKQVPHCQHRAWHGARTQEPWDHDLNQNQELDTYLTEPPRCPLSSNSKTWATQLPE